MTERPEHTDPADDEPTDEWDPWADEPTKENIRPPTLDEMRADLESRH